MKQLYLIDAIDENGAITSIGHKMAGTRFLSLKILHVEIFTLAQHQFAHYFNKELSLCTFFLQIISKISIIAIKVHQRGYFFSFYCAELPLEPSLSRTLMEANNYGCISQALTVAAMLSAETSLLLSGRRLRHLKLF